MSKSLDRLTLLSTFVRIAERGSISAAARDIGLSQASASRQLAELEERLGIQLIRRTTHALALTRDGEQVLSDARILLDGWEALSDRFAQSGGRLAGDLKVVAPVALGQQHLAAAAIEFQNRHPDVSITWVLDDDPIRFAETGCDLWIKIGIPSDDRLVVRNIGSVERLIVAAPSLLSSAPVKMPSDLDSLPLAALAPFEGAAIPLKNAQGSKRSVAARPVMTTNNIYSAYEAAKRGIGFAVMPRWFVDDDLNTGHLVDVLPAWRAPERTVTASVLPGRHRTRRLVAFRDHMIDAIRSVPGIRPAE